MPASLAFQFIYAVSALDSTGSWVGREWCWAEASVALTLFIEGASLGMWAPCLIVGGGDQPRALRALVSSAPVDCIYYLVLPWGIHRLFLWGLGTHSFICVHPCSIPCQKLTYLMFPGLCPAPPTAVQPLTQPPVPLEAPATHTSVHTFKRPGQLAALSTGGPFDSAPTDEPTNS